MLQDKKINMPVNLKQRLCSIIGQMVRHATQIESEVINKGLANCLIDVVKNDGSVKVRKTAIAALGEYLFYIATQIDDQEENTDWIFPENTYDLFNKIFKTTEEDEIIKFYMIKTVENITAQSVKIGNTFANENTVKNVLKLMNGCKNDNIKNTCIVVLGHICRVNYECIYHVYDSLKIKGLISLFTEINSKALQAILNVFNLGFQSTDYNIKLKS